MGGLSALCWGQSGGHVSHCVEWLVTPSPPTLVHGVDGTRACTKGPSLLPQVRRRQPTFHRRGRRGEKESVGCGTGTP